MSKRKYHMKIPVDEEWNKPLDDGGFDLETHLCSFRMNGCLGSKDLPGTPYKVDRARV